MLPRRRLRHITGTPYATTNEALKGNAYRAVGGTGMASFPAGSRMRIKTHDRTRAGHRGLHRKLDAGVGPKGGCRPVGSHSRSDSARNSLEEWDDEAEAEGSAAQRHHSTGHFAASDFGDGDNDADNSDRTEDQACKHGNRRLHQRHNTLPMMPPR